MLEPEDLFESMAVSLSKDIGATLQINHRHRHRHHHGDGVDDGLISGSDTDPSVVEEESFQVLSLAKADPNVFYHDSGLYYNPPTRPKPLKCTSRSRCKSLLAGDPAVFKCYSCVKFDAAGKGYYCEACFRYRHPWYRVEHNFVTIDEADDTEHEIAAQLYRAEVERAMDDLKVLIEQVKDWNKRIAEEAVLTLAKGKLEDTQKAADDVQCQIHDLIDMTMEQGVKVTRETLDELKAEALAMQKAFERDTFVDGDRRETRLGPGRVKHGDPYIDDPYEDIAALTIQCAWRRYLSICRALARVRSRYTRHAVEGKEGVYFFKDRRTGVTQWERPVYITKERVTRVLLTPRHYKRLFRNGKPKK